MLRHGLRESTFRIYEPDIRKAVALSPVPHRIKTNQSITYSARLRDAIRSLELYHWSTDINLDQFLALRKKRMLQVHIDSTGDVVLGALENESIPLESTSLSRELIITCIEEANLLCLLLSMRWLAGPILVHSTLNLATMGEKFDVLVESLSNGDYKIQ